MSHESLRKLVQSALFAALCTAMTLVIQVPSPVSGYVNLGDCGVLLSAWVLGPWYGGAAASIPGNLVQGVFSLAAALALISALERSKALSRL